MFIIEKPEYDCCFSVVFEDLLANQRLYTCFHYCDNDAMLMVGMDTYVSCGLIAPSFLPVYRMLYISSICST